MVTLRPGQIIGVRVGTVTHLGIVSDHFDEHGIPLIYSNSLRSGRVALEPLVEFKGPYEFATVAQPTNLPAWQVLARARHMLGMRWNLFTWNCEHFVFSAYGLPPQSPQLQAAGVLLGLTILCAKFARI